MPTVTSALSDPSSQFSVAMAQDFPNTKLLRELAREACGSILVAPEGSVDRSALGAAFDVLAATTLRPQAASVLADRDIDEWWTPNHAWLARNTGLAVEQLLSDGNRGLALCKLVWVQGLLVNSMRSGEAYRRSGITAVLRTSTVTRHILNGLDELLTFDGLTQLQKLDGVAQEKLYPHVRGPVHVHADISWDGVQAEADIIAGGTLLDLKTSAGTQNAAGEWRMLPPVRDMHQLIAYTHMASEPEREAQYGSVREVGFYFARYGGLVQWPVDAFLATASP